MPTPQPAAFVSARTAEHGDIDALAVGSTVHPHLDPATGLEYLHRPTQPCLDGYERPREEQLVAASLSKAVNEPCWFCKNRRGWRCGACGRGW